MGIDLVGLQKSLIEHFETFGAMTYQIFPTILSHLTQSKPDNNQPSRLMNWPNKLECLSLASLSDHAECNTSAYWAHSWVRKRSDGPILLYIIKYKIITNYYDNNILSEDFVRSELLV
jgi:hypothetical protein